LHGTGVSLGWPLLCEEFFIGLDCTFPLAEDCSIGSLDVPEEIKDFAYRLHLPVSYLTIEWGKLGGITLNNEHPVANGAHRPSNNFHNNLMDTMVLKYFGNLYMCDSAVFKHCVKV
jgi:hypothetical protein